MIFLMNLTNIDFTKIFAMLVNPFIKPYFKEIQAPSKHLLGGFDTWLQDVKEHLIFDQTLQ